MRLLLAALLTLLCAAQALALDVPPLSGRVVDLADLLSPRAEREIAAMSAQLEKSDSTQIAVLTVPSLEGEPLAEYALKAAETWGLGQGEEDNGALLLVAKAERKVRIEVGYGLEGRLTDLMAGRIVDLEIIPRFKQGDFDSGVLAGVTAMAQAVRGEYKAGKSSRRKDSDSPWGLLIPLVLFTAMMGQASRTAGAVGGAVAAPFLGSFVFGTGLGILLLLALGGFALGLIAPIIAGPFLFRRHRHYGGYWGGFGGGGFGGGGFSGGGFSGGGGGFGGGGASGGW